MNDEIVGKLAKLVEQQVCAALIANGYARLEEAEDNLLFDNLIINSTVSKKIKLTSTGFYDDEDFLKELISIFPPGKFSCSTNVLNSRLKAFMRKTKYVDITQDEILTAARTWMSRHNSPYHGTLVNFIFKMDNKVYTSRLETIVEEMRDDKLNTPNLVEINTQISFNDI